MAKLLILSDSSRYSISKLTDELVSMGHQVKYMNISNEPLALSAVNEYDLTVLTSMNPYTALSIALTIGKSINSAAGIINALSVTKLLKEQGLDFLMVAGDSAVKSAFTNGPYYFNTAWSLGLGGFVDTVEGARSILEYRHYLKNPLASASILVKLTGEESRVFATIKHSKYGELLRRLNLHFAELTVIDGKVTEANPTPEIPVESVKEVAQVVAEYAAGINS
ncbi:hypothetical protein [Caldivirga maquilingensis]|uniref:Uncharacterized protein n=1 Tax=Caldivirga maquilingensis (strain ATCC 700844 / DSM 13496 / JCM 10307 / IC-167) TaxID=397948 RepID=A8MBG7_CALMQ|nr:hypothetical protein [Caldivirga maquilingensis]ABW02700.1 conserved hypothetical protein [Caldivirga maquilingensis IC-167]